jgi:hypothetical protein
VNGVATFNNITVSKGGYRFHAHRHRRDPDQRHERGVQHRQQRAGQARVHDAAAVDGRNPGANFGAVVHSAGLPAATTVVGNRLEA